MRISVILFLLSLVPLFCAVMNLLIFGYSITSITVANWFSISAACACFTVFGYLFGLVIREII